MLVNVVSSPISKETSYPRKLEDTARYAGLLLAPAEGFLCCFGPFLAIFGVQ